MIRSRVVNTIDSLCTGTVLLVVLVTSSSPGAWIAIVAMTALFVIMKLIHRHYAAVSRELANQSQVDDIVLPSRNHAVVLVSKAAPADAAGAGLRAQATGPTSWRPSRSASTTVVTKQLVQMAESDISVCL